MEEREHDSFVIEATPDGAYTLSVHINGRKVRVRYVPKNDEERGALADAERNSAPLDAVVRAGVFIVGVRARSSRGA